VYFYATGEGGSTVTHQNPQPLFVKNSKNFENPYF
jgi:hypothetical protein